MTARRRVFGGQTEENYDGPQNSNFTHYHEQQNAQQNGSRENGSSRHQGTNEYNGQHQQQNGQEQKYPPTADSQHSQHNPLPHQHNDRGRTRPRRKPKYMPLTKTQLELFSENCQIKQGEHFEDLFGWQRNPDIVITGDDGIEQTADDDLTIQNFEDCGLSAEILRNIKFRKYTKPTPIQRAIIPLLLGNTQMDIIAHAETGSGKTAAFMLPIINRLQWMFFKGLIQPNQLRKAPYCIILAPTRELTEQLFLEARAFSVDTRVRVARSYGDMPMRGTMEKIEQGCDILVVTSGRLRHHVQGQHINLTNLRYFVLDEGDQLLKERTFCDTVEYVQQHEDIGPDLQMLLFSATFEREVQIFAANVICRRRPYKFVKTSEINRPARAVTQHFLEVDNFDKRGMLLEILKEGADEKWLPGAERRILQPRLKTIVFCELKRHSDLIGRFLCQEDIVTESLNADRTCQQRCQTVEKFTRGHFDVLVATDVAARGLNFPNVDHVIIYDLPERKDADEMYIHRIGRTGRAGNAGKATIFFDPTNDANLGKAGHYLELLESNNQEVPDFLRRLANENLENDQERFYAGDRLPSWRENVWGPNVPQEHHHQQTNGYHYQDQHHYHQQSHSQQQEEHGWGPRMPTSSREYRRHQEMPSSSGASLYSGQSSSHATSTNEPTAEQDEEYLHDTF